MTNKEDKIIASPADHFELSLRCLIREHMPKDSMDEYNKLIGGLFGYFRLPYSDKLKEAENKVASLNQTVSFRDAEIKRLENIISEQGKIIKESGIKELMSEIREKIETLQSMARVKL